MTCFTPIDTNNCFSNVYIREVVRSEIQKAAECFEGDSAYSIAVKNGYVGTEDEWLASLGGTITDIKAVALEAGSAPSANLGGTPRNRIINLGIPKGERGKEGIQGIPGPIGLSAYDVAVANGFNGTKTDWLLAIKGAKGDAGPEGPEGKEGKSTYELSVDYGYSGSEREWLTGIVNDTELMSNLNKDLLSIDKAANGNINTTVVTRTGETYPSVKKAISEGIVSLFENGGLPATPFATKALMTASALVDGDYAMVTNNTANNGLYVKTAGAWVRSEYSPVVESSLQSTASQVPSCWFIDPYYEWAGNTLYFKPSIHLGAVFFAYPPLVKKYRTTISWEDYKTMMQGEKTEDVFVTSPQGVADCIKIPKWDGIVYYPESNTLKLESWLTDNPSSPLSSKNSVLIVSYDQLGRVGAGTESYKAEIAKIAKPIPETIQQTQLYMNGIVLGGVESIPEIKTRQGVNGLDLHLKIPSLRLRENGRTYLVLNTWQSFVDKCDSSVTFFPEITDPENPDGIIPEYIVLKDNSLVYDLRDGKFKATPTIGYNLQHHVLIATSIYGILIDGLLFNWNQSVNAALPKPTAPSTEISVLSSLTGTPNTRFIAHGGMNGFMQFAPLNSAPAYRNAGEYGYWGAETDIVETKDGEWIHCHDPFLSDYIVGGTGNFKDYTLAEIKEMDATKKSVAFGWSDVPPLELSEFLEICRQYGMTPVIEFKSVPTAAGVNKVLSLINSSVGESNCVLMSFNQGVLDLIRSISSRIKLFLLTFAMSQTHTAKALSLGNCGLSVQSSSTAANIKQAREAGVEVGIWTVSQGQIDSDLAKGVDYVTTDIGVPYDFKKGVATYNFKNAADFSNLTSKGTATAENSKLTIPASSNVYLDIPVSYGDVITVSCEAKAADGGSTITIRGLNSSLATVRDYTARAIKVGNFAVHTAASVVYDKTVTSVRVLVSSGGTAASIRDIKIKKYEV